MLRGVTLADAPIGGLDNDQLDAEFDRISSIVETAPVYIETPGAAYQIDAERLGLTLDRRATRAAVLSAGREGSSIVRPFSWLGALFSDREVEAVVRLDPLEAEAGLAAVSKTISVEPGEPTLQLQNGRLELEAGAAGTILDVEQLVRDLGTRLPTEPGQEIFVDAVTTTDDVVDVEIQSLVDQINGSTTRAIEFMVNGLSLRAQPEEFRSWITLDLTTLEPQAKINTEIMYRWINAAAGIAQGEIDTRALLVDDDQVRLPAANAVLCCEAEVGQNVLDAVLDGERSFELALIEDDLTPLVDLGISELIGEFTTAHERGEDRVINIQRMADLVRGAVIEPGDTFSLNDHVGQRTTGKGFVPAGVIYNGVFTEEVGGGVSQFATTLFNASFFGGLDFVSYQPHSIFIDRYPFGREATVNWPSVDLAVRNPTDSPVLIWSEYTDSSITVKLFGTNTITSEQTNQTTEPLNECTRVRTERTRTFADGRVEVDQVGAIYQPEEGRDCDGNPTEPPPECERGEVLVDTDNDDFGDTCGPTSEVCPLDTEVIVNRDGVLEFCSTEDCPAQTQAIDTNDDGTFDICDPIEQQDADDDQEEESEDGEDEDGEPSEDAEPEDDGDG